VVNKQLPVYDIEKFRYLGEENNFFGTFELCDSESELAMGMLNYHFYENRAPTFEHINKDSSIIYLEKAVALKNTFNSTTKAAITDLTQKENERQKVKQEAEEKIHQARTRNIQYMAISVGLMSVIIMYLLYSRSIIANPKLMRFLGVLVLLIVFEFINLLFHPSISELTHDSPLLMLLIMVTIASLLVPAHHKLEHLVSHQLVEKNKKIKLIAARKIIDSLEKEKN